MTAVTIGTPMPAMIRVVRIDPARDHPRELDQRLGAFGGRDIAQRQVDVRESTALVRTMSRTFTNAARGVDDERDVGRQRVPRSDGGRAHSAAAEGRRAPVAFGMTAFWMSLTVISPFSRKSLSTTSSFSTLCRCRFCAQREMSCRPER
jgi:hypothetical protein